MKGTKIVIVEDLTRSQMQLLKASYDHGQVTNSSTKDGTVYALLENMAVVKIWDDSDLANLRSLPPIKQKLRPGNQHPSAPSQSKDT